MALYSSVTLFSLLLLVWMPHASLTFVHSQEPPEYTALPLDVVKRRPLDGSQRSLRFYRNRKQPETLSRLLSLANDHQTSMSSALEFTRHDEPTKASRRLEKERGESAIVSVCPQNCSCEYRQGTKIDVVDCSRRGVQDIPPLPSSAREVYLQGNHIHGVPCSAFTHLNVLITLDLSQNKIDVLFRCSFASTISLQYLSLAQCQLGSLPAGVFDSMQHLLELDLSQNDISAISPQLFPPLRNLIRLDLGKNSLTKIRNGLSSLEFLSLEGNKLRYLPGTFELEAFHGLMSIKLLHLEGNQPHLVDLP